MQTNMQDQNPARSPPQEPQPPAMPSPPPQSQPVEMMPPPPPPPPPQVFQPMSIPIPVPPQYQAVVMPPPMHYHNPYMLPPQYPNYQYLPNDHHNAPHQLVGYERNWSTGLLDCFMDINTCLKTTICPCITFGQIAEIINEGQTIWYEPALLYMIIEMIGGFTNEILPIHITFLYTCLYRTKMRERYKLRGSKVEDCFVHFFCEYCALCQEYRELEQRGFHVSLGWEKNKERERQATTLYQYVPPVPQEMMR